MKTFFIENILLIYHMKTIKAKTCLVQSNRIFKILKWAYMVENAL
uniref:Uncharacterized protein n=1 Tax=Rhizophora mucronata TaxID=61149 RepID=A0A2P2L611_RHIMU